MDLLEIEEQIQSWRAVHSLLTEHEININYNSGTRFRFFYPQGYSFTANFEFEFKRYGYNEPYFIIRSDAFKSPDIFQTSNPQSNKILFTWNEIDKRLEFKLNNKEFYITK